MKIAGKITVAALLWLIFINPGTINNIDTSRRLNMSHAWWTGTEEGIAGDNLVINVDDKKYIPYDLGQSMLMLPIDWLGTKLGEDISSEFVRRNLTEAMVSFLVFVPVNLFCVLTYFNFLQLLNYSKINAALSSIVFMLGTSFLFYSSFHQQNNQILLCVLLSYQSILTYVIKNQKKWAIISGIALGIAFLIRITSILYAVSIFIFLIGCIVSREKNKLLKKSFRSIFLWMSGFLPLVFLERILTYIRYGSWKATSTSLLLQVFAKADTVNSSNPVVEGSPENFSFLGLLDNVKLEALYAPFISPEKSIFLYDPLVLPCLILLIICWKSLSKIIQWYLIAATIGFLLHLYIYSWTSDWIYQLEWGLRYHITSLHLWLVPLIPLLVTGAIARQNLNKNQLKKNHSIVARTIICLAVAIQFASILLPFNLEANQQQLSIGSQWRVKQRINNIAYMLKSQPNFRIQKVEQYWQSQFNNPDIKVTWDLLPFKYQDKIPPESSARKFIPLLFIAWTIIFVAAVSATIWIFV